MENRAAVNKLAFTLLLALSGLMALPASAQQVEYYHLDALGSVRAVTDASGAIVVRHDYEPYGREWNEPESSDTRRFTGKERDDESGLDYFEMRYYGTTTGRFTSVDPVRAVSAMADPQQWNRYAYARNNPLRYLDPHGLYVFNAAATDQQRDAFRDALESAGRARNNLSGSQRDAVSRALEAYGAEGEENGVTVGFGRLQRGEAGSTEGRGLNPDTLLGDIVVTFDLNQAGNDLPIHVAHEGSHTADFGAFYAALVADPAARTGRSSVVGGPHDLTKYDTETRAFLVSGYTARGLGRNQFSVDGQMILNQGRINPAAIGRMLRTSTLYQLTPVNPGARLSGQ